MLPILVQTQDQFADVLSRNDQRQKTFRVRAQNSQAAIGRRATVLQLVRASQIV